MIHSLLSVCLLTMGVGAKASTPIELNRQETQPTQKKQYANENEETATISYAKNYTRQWELDTPHADYEPGYGVTNELKETYDLQNTNINAELIRCAEYEYKQRTDEYGNLINNDTNFYFIEDQLTSYRYQKEYYGLKIYGANLGFKNTTLKIEIETSDIQIDGYYNYELAYTTEITVFQTIENTENIFNPTNIWRISPTEYYNEFVNGKYAPSVSKYKVTNNYPATPNIELNLKLIANNTNYIYIFVNYNVHALNPNDEAQYLADVNSMDVRFLAQNGIQSAISELKFYLPQVNKTAFEVTTTTVDIENITQEVIDLPGLLWEILAMPFAFISTAFNLTLFPNTAYALNISNLVLTIFGVLVFIFILKKIKP